jgi:hypothetical protein
LNLRPLRPEATQLTAGPARLRRSAAAWVSVGVRRDARPCGPVVTQLVTHATAVGAIRETAAVILDPTDGDAVIAELVARVMPTSEIAGQAPAAPGLYAWWASPTILPELRGSAHPADESLRLLYIGIATKLRSRLRQNHMKRTGSSTLRRTLAGLLLGDEAFHTRWTDRVVLVDEDEVRLTSWMATNLRVSWCEHPTPREVEAMIIEKLAPPLNVDHASGSVREVIRAARQRYYASAGPRPVV